MREIWCEDCKDWFPVSLHQTMWMKRTEHVRSHVILDQPSMREVEQFLEEMYGGELSDS